MTFEDQLKEIDNNLGLDSGVSNEPLTLPNRNDSYQISKARVVRFACDVAGPNDNGPLMDSKAHSRGPSKPTKPTGGTWKRILHEPNGPQSPYPPLHTFKHGKTDFLELEPVRMIKKPKNDDGASGSNDMQISAVVAEQPRRTP
jgi:hypothetical protein